MKEKELIQKFEEVFGKGETPHIYFAPGRVNLIGEHTDYNGGHVFPCALSMGAYGVVRKRADRKLNFYSLNYEKKGMLTSSLDDFKYEKKNNWSNYPLGVIWSFHKKGFKLDTGFDLLVWGNIPSGSGLSSSAALLIMTGTLLKEEYQLSDVSKLDVAVLGLYAENHFCGLNCGIMDQFVSTFGKKDCAVFLNTNDLSYEYAPLNLTEETIVITNSNVKHSMVGSQYNVRHEQCMHALKEVQKVMEVDSLCELSDEDFEKVKESIADGVERRRAKHAVYENQRTILAKQALNEGNLERFGELMNQSHTSLRDDFEVSCPEVDYLVERALELPKVLGSRITGGGFGGCTVSLVKKDGVEEFQKHVGEAYLKKYGLKADFYNVEVGEGARELL